VLGLDREVDGKVDSKVDRGLNRGRGWGLNDKIHRRFDRKDLARSRLRSGCDRWGYRRGCFPGDDWGLR
jgi:hypothetical protein